MTYIHKLVDVPVLGNLPVQYIISEGKKDVEPVPKHWHAALEVNCVLRGQASVYMAGQTYLMQAGDALGLILLQCTPVKFSAMQKLITELSPFYTRLSGSML